jgi:hypothetical protein
MMRGQALGQDKGSVSARRSAAEDDDRVVLRLLNAIQNAALELSHGSQELAKAQCALSAAEAGTSVPASEATSSSSAESAVPAAATAVKACSVLSPFARFLEEMEGGVSSPLLPPEAADNAPFRNELQSAGVDAGSALEKEKKRKKEKKAKKRKEKPKPSRN